MANTRPRMHRYQFIMIMIMNGVHFSRALPFPRLCQFAPVLGSYCVSGCVAQSSSGEDLVSIIRVQVCISRQGWKLSGVVLPTTAPCEVSRHPESSSFDHFRDSVLSLRVKTFFDVRNIGLMEVAIILF